LEKEDGSSEPGELCPIKGTADEFIAVRDRDNAAEVVFAAQSNAIEFGCSMFLHTVANNVERSILRRIRSD
jgi:hypothetical protein